MPFILVVEDEPTSRRIMVSRLRRFGYQVVGARDGACAWSIIEDNPDILAVVTDYQMPWMSGEQLLIEMRQHKKTVNIPVIMVSGYLGLRGVNKLLELGLDRFQHKPVDFYELQENLDSVLRKAKVAS